METILLRNNRSKEEHPVIKLISKKTVATPHYAFIDIIGTLNESSQHDSHHVLVHSNNRTTLLLCGHIIKQTRQFDPHHSCITKLTLSTALFPLTQHHSQSVLFKQTIKCFVQPVLFKTTKMPLTIRWHNNTDKIICDLFIQAKHENDYDFFCRLLNFFGLTFIYHSNDPPSMDIFPLQYMPSTTPINISYQDPSRLVSEEEKYCLYLTVNYQQPLEHISLRDHDNQFSDILLYNQKGNPKSLWSAQYYGQGRKNHKEVEHFLTTYLARKNLLHEHLILKTSCLNVSPGGLIQLNSGDFPMNVSGTYRVLSVLYSYQLHNKPLQVKVTLIPQQSFIPIYINIKKILSYQHSYLKKTIQKNHSCLDKKGHYWVQWKNNNPKDITAPRLLYFVGKQHKSTATTWHYPLLNNQTIVVNLIHGQPHRPIITANIPKKSESPVTAHNKTQHIISTKNKSFYLFDDHPKNPGLSFANKTLGYKLSLHDNQDTSIHINSQLGNIKIQGKNILTQAKKDIKKIIYHHSCSKAEQHNIISGETIHYQAQSTLQTTAQHTITLQSNKKLSIHSANNIVGLAQNIIFDAKNFFIKTSNASITAIQDVTLQAGKSIILSSGTSAIELTSAGIINCYGPIITAGPTNFLGVKIKHHFPGMPYINHFFLEKWPQKIIQALESDLAYKIDQLHWSKSSAASGESVQCEFNVAKIDRPRQATLVIECHTNNQVTACDKIPVQLKKIIGTIKISWNTHIKNTPNKKNHEKSSCFLTFFIEMDGKRIHHNSNNMTILINLTLYHGTFIHGKYTVINNGWYTILFSLNGSKKKLEQIKKIIHGKTQFNRISWAPSNITTCATDNNNIFEIIDSYDNQPNYHQQLNLSNDNPNKTIHKKIHYLTPPMICNMRDDADVKHPWTRFTLNQEELNYCKQSNNCAIIFIHGFNVVYGEFGKHFEDVDLVDLSTLDELADLPLSGKLSAICSSVNATSYRELPWLIKRFPIISQYKNSQLDKWLDSQTYLNGKGAHNWFVNMEYNLNHANGFSHKNFKSYRRIINIAWSGDMSCALNYPHATKTAKTAAKKLTKLITQLKKHNLKISIIAHSLGCGVTLMAMQHLAEQGFNNVIDCVTLWEAAVPCDVFFPIRPKHLSSPLDPWYLPNAVQAAKKIIVLSSHNDNILGPIPEKGPLTASTEKILAQKPFWTELVPAKILQALGLHSVYAAATWMGVSVTDLLDTNQQKTIYQQWIALHPLDKHNKKFPEHFYDFILADQQLHALSHQALKKNTHSQWHSIESWINNNEHKPIKNIPGFILNWIDTLDESKKRLKLSTKRLLQSLHGALSLAHLMFKHVDYAPLPALGYSGPLMNDKIQQMINQNKLVLINQDQFLFSHSGMKIPSKALQTHVYRKLIKELPEF